MSASLSPPVDEEFALASDDQIFFSRELRRKIQVQFESREQPATAAPGKSCTTNLFFGFFFDGTKNNYEQAELTKNHSNVARLYDCYPGLSVPGVLPPSTDWTNNPSRYTHFFRVYIPGVASPFPQVGDVGTWWQSKSGAGAGGLGDYRIAWALIQAVNNVHRYFLKAPLISPAEAKELSRKLVLNKVTRALLDDSKTKTGKLSNLEQETPKEFEAMLRRLHAAVSKHWPDEKTGKPAKSDPGIVKTIYVSVFGFSRGATEARVFVNWLSSLCKLDAKVRGKTGGKSLGGFDIQFDFLGLFDTVASVGLANSFGIFDGHGFWADAEESLRIPPGIKCLHLVAAHELRRSFPVDSISVKGVLPEGCEEIVVPGVHSDVGSGYCPSEQGRGCDPGGADMLTRIPLLMMYKAARLNGVPLKLELANSVAKERFAIKPEVIKAFNAYIATCSEKHGPIHRIMREQARKQIEWRLVRRVVGTTPIQKSGSFARASTFDQNDLYSAACEFEEEIKAFMQWLAGKGNGFRASMQAAGFGNSHAAEWEEIATWWSRAPVVSPAVVEFFDNYVHDSRAWFKIVPGNPDNEKDMRDKLDAWVRRRKEVANHNAVRSQFHGRGSSVYQMHADDGLTEDQRRARDEYEKTGRIPRFVTEGREPWGTPSDLVRCAGYLRFRKIYGGSDSDLLS
ncbi:Uncharacterized alpha/beta hydrolase domain [Massilia sp. PDC64]|nr:DUF2235 domain-containing protein [Massilia sp. PDC64]SDC91684.1 Uncharacterized alpha/beta hydrolase domain [Massilia sp. PDC64]